MQNPGRGSRFLKGDWDLRARKLVRKPKKHIAVAMKKECLGLEHCCEVKQEWDRKLMTRFRKIHIFGDLEKSFQWCALNEQVKSAGSHEKGGTDVAVTLQVPDYSFFFKLKNLCREIVLWVQYAWNQVSVS